MLRKLLFCISGFAALIGAQVLAREAELSDFGQRSESLSWLQPDPEFIDPDHETIDVGRSMGELFVPDGQFEDAASTLNAFNGCMDAPYTPTLWLPRNVERRRSLYFSTMAAIACEHGIPANLLDAVIAQESGYNSWAISSAGAMGMMQVMPGTARILGLSQPFEPIANMRAGARYLRQQIDRFGRIDLALAAYNAGPERRSLKAGYIPAIPETQHYIRTITTNWARLASRTPVIVSAEDRSAAAMLAVRASGYRTVDLVSYDGSNASNPM